VKNLKLLLLLTPLGLVTLVASCAIQAQIRVWRAKTFCESLVPAIQAARDANGRYPSKADPRWWAGRTVPWPIRAQDFYLPDDAGKTFLLRFEDVGDPLCFIDTVWGFDSRWMGWVNYDGY
jgi:hypothetical protein